MNEAPYEYTDRRGCLPRKDIIIEEAIKRDDQVTIVTSFAHYSNAPHPSGVKTVHVDSGADAADFKIIQLAKEAICWSRRTTVWPHSLCQWDLPFFITRVSPDITAIWNSCLKIAT